MAVQPQYLAYILEQLEALGRLRSRRMFGGVGLYSGELFFGLIDDDTLFFKTDGTNSADYIARNMPRFMPFPDRPEAVMAYYQVPADIIEDAESLVTGRASPSPWRCARTRRRRAQGAAKAKARKTPKPGKRRSRRPKKENGTTRAERPRR